jgi:hypothetical protein
MEDGKTNQEKCSRPLGGFRATMKPFHHVIRLRVKGSWGDAGNVEERGKLSPKGGSTVNWEPQTDVRISKRG